ncbi:MAG: nucleotide exchange factor GrpE [Betaproteobacteria bacterium]|nr:nucleotide exchange factor GrpE [Betaproteobacteria bacterium]
MNQDDDKFSQGYGDAAEGAGTAADSMPGLDELLRKAELQAQEHHDAWLRAKADAENVRKRAQIDVANAHKFGVESFANSLLPVKDSLEAALAAQNDTVESLRGGVELTLKQLDAVFDKFTLTEINPVGEKFDPHRHEAMTMVEADAEPNTVVQVLQKGYALHDRVIRPALVSVAAPKRSLA